MPLIRPLLLTIALLFSTPAASFVSTLSCFNVDKNGEPIVFEGVYDGVDKIKIMPNNILFINGEPKTYEIIKAEGFIALTFDDEELADGAFQTITITSPSDITLTTVIPSSGLFGWLNEPRETSQKCMR